MSIRKQLRKSLLDGLTEASTKSKPLSFLSHPVPECSCFRRDTDQKSQLKAALGSVQDCPAWMHIEKVPPTHKDNEEDLDEDDSLVSGLFFRPNHENGGGEINKEEAPMEDQDELEGGE